MRPVSEARRALRMKTSLAAIVLFACSTAATLPGYGFGGAGYSLTSNQRDAIAADIESTILSVTEPDEDGNLFYPFVAGFVRLAFHQCVSGKCIGCVNVNDANNLHLSRYVDALEPVRRRNPYIRYGDLWALAGIVAAQIGERRANSRNGRLYSYTKNIQFRYGREDCPTAPYTTTVFEFPSFARGLDHITSFFSRKFGMYDWEVAALLGAHKLGGARRPSDGRIARQWTSFPDCLDNSYYITMVDGRQNWYQSAHTDVIDGSSIFLWTTGAHKRLMFNSDICLLKDVSFVNNIDGEARCRFDTCPSSRTYNWVTLFAQSNDVWLTYFYQAFQKMGEVGYPIWTLQYPKTCVGTLCF